MVRPNRTSTRIAFLLVIAMAALGFWYARANWQFQPDPAQFDALLAEGDWVDMLSALGEEAIQLFLGISGG